MYTDCDKGEKASMAVRKHIHRASDKKKEGPHEEAAFNLEPTVSIQVFM
jgi:hypothetical protein